MQTHEQRKNINQLDDARASETAMVLKLQATLDDLARILSTRMADIDDVQIEDIPVRLLPQMLKSFIDGLTVLQASHDRISGYAILMRELEAAIESRDTKTNNH